MLMKTFKYRCYPNRTTRQRAYRAFAVFGRVWTNAIKERYRAYFKWRDVIWQLKQQAGSGITEKRLKAIQKKASEKIHIPTFYDQYAMIRKRDLPKDHDYQHYDAQSLQNVLHKVDASFKSYRKLRENGFLDAEPPNQKRAHHCIAYRQSGWHPNSAEQINEMEVPSVTLTNIGRFKLRLHRLIEGRIKLVTITEKNGKWYCSFACEINEITRVCRPMSAAKSSNRPDLRQEYILTGGSNPEKRCIDNWFSYDCNAGLGGSDPEKGCTDNVSLTSKHRSYGGSNLEKRCTDNNPNVRKEVEIRFPGGCFLSDSNGFQANHPDFYFNELDRLRRLNRNLSRKKPGSKNRKKARRILANWHEHIHHKRDYWLWSWARFYAVNFSKITLFEHPWKLKIKHRAIEVEALRLCDVAYSRFIEMLRHKCKEFGTELIIRKDEQWQSQKEELLERARLKELKRLLRRARKALLQRNRDLLPSLERDRKRVATLQI